MKYHDSQINVDKKAVKRMLNKLRIANSDCENDNLFFDLLDLKIADTLAQNLEYSVERKIAAEKLREIYFEIKENQEALSISDLAVNGRDLMEIGIPEGKKIGEVLKRLLNLVLENPELNNKEILLEHVKTT